MSDEEVILNDDEPQTLFTRLQTEFPIAEENIRTEKFLEAAKATVSMIERFGKVFSPVTHDMRGNILKLLDKYKEDKDQHEYLEVMVMREHVNGESVATDALLWLRRGLNFVCHVFQSVIEDAMSERYSNDLAPYLRRAYVETLEPYHGWLGMQLFNVLSRFAPTRRHLLYTLASDRHNMDELVIEHMRTYTARLRECIRKLNVFYVGAGLESS